MKLKISLAKLKKRFKHSSREETVIILRLIEAYEELEKGVSNYNELVKKEWLCRDISKDIDPDWALKQLEFLPKFKQAFESLDRAKEILEGRE